MDAKSRNKISTSLPKDQIRRSNLGQLLKKSCKRSLRWFSAWTARRHAPINLPTTGQRVWNRPTRLCSPGGDQLAQLRKNSRIGSQEKCFFSRKIDTWAAKCWFFFLPQGKIKFIFCRESWKPRPPLRARQLYGKEGISIPYFTKNSGLLSPEVVKSHDVSHQTYGELVEADF